MDLIKVVEQAFANERVASYPKFKAGDTITVLRIKLDRQQDILYSIGKYSHCF